MVTLKRVMRASSIVEIQCPHGIGHPTLESATRVADHHKEWEGKWGKERGMTREDGISAWTVHGCDGCCKNYKECRGDMNGKEDSS